MTNAMWSFDNERAQEYVRVRQEFIREFLESVRGEVALETAIDVGCGVGHMSKFLSDLGLLAVAIEGREENTLEARRRYPEITFLTINVEDPAVSELGVFDLTLCVGLLYHLENPFRAIRNLHSLTGKLLIVESMCTPGKDPEMVLLDEGRENNQGLSYVAFYPTEACLIKMLDRAGFPFVYRFRRAPADEQFKNTLMRKRWRTILAASKVELNTENLVPAAELVKWQYTAPKPWGTVLSNSRDFCYGKMLAIKNRLIRMMGSAGGTTHRNAPEEIGGVRQTIHDVAREFPIWQDRAGPEVEMQMTTAPSLLDRARSSFEQIEKGTLPPPVKVAARFARRAGRSVLLRTRATKRVLSAKMIKRNIIYPIRNVVLGNEPLAVNAGGLSYVLAPEGAIPLEMWAGRYFERQELEFVLSVLGPGMTFVDVGANVGMFSIAAAKKVQDGRVLAFEPCGWTYKRLIKNQVLNGVTNLQTIHSALGERAGEAILRVNVAGKDGLNTLGRPTHGDSEVVDTEKVRVGTLDEALQQRGISRVDVMKMDVEGAELFVLLGARRLLSRANAPLILYEGSFLSKGFDYHPVEEMWLLQKHGYSLFVLDSKDGRISRPPKGRAYDASIIAVKASHPAYARVKERAS